METTPAASAFRRASVRAADKQHIKRESSAVSSTGACKYPPSTMSGLTSQPYHQEKRSTQAGNSHVPLKRADSTSRYNDPFVNRQQAEVAAVEAYCRAQKQTSHDLTAGEARPKLERRRSRVSGRTEGGHFEEARLGRRKSGSKQARRESRKTTSSPHRSSEMPSSDHISGMEPESVVTRKRAVVPPSSSTLAAPMTADRGKKRYSQMGHSDGSPMPRHSAAGKQRSSEAASSLHAAPSHTTIDAITPVRQELRAQERSSYTDEQSLAQARDRCLQDFQQKRVRERKSMILAPFQKLKTLNTLTSRTNGFDTSLPPFNYAEEGVTLPPSSPPTRPPPAAPVYTIPVHEIKSRSFTESVKGRFMKAFRKPSRAPSGLPAQQVDGRTFRFSTTTPRTTADVVPETEDDPFVAPNQFLAVPDTRAGSARSKHTTNTTSKSCVTSWTNSTVAGTWSTRSVATKDPAADEFGRLKRSDSVSTLRKTKSFFSRPIQSKLRRPSRAQLASSEESTGLYSALQEQICPSDSASQAESHDDAAAPRTSSALATLPSQRCQIPNLANSIGRAGPTIRSVTPDANAYKLDIPSPVIEVLSPEAKLPYVEPTPDDAADTPRSQLQRRPAIKAPTPSKEQLWRRLERSKNRWQSPLDEMSPTIVPRFKRAAITEDNPYELRSLSRTLQQAPAASDALPHHAWVAPDRPRQDTRADNVLSPSLYSRATDGASPRPDTPVEQSGMMITITGREVRSYSISPPKRETKAEKPAVASGEWRRWLSNEWKGWNASEVLTLPKTILQSDEPVSSGLQNLPYVHREDFKDQRADSETPPLQAPPLDSQQQKRPRPRSSRSSFMNERYPMVDSGRTTSDVRTVSLRVDSRPSSSGTTTARPSGNDSKLSHRVPDETTKAEMQEEERPATVLHRQRAVSKHQSVFNLQASSRKQDYEKPILDDDSIAPTTTTTITDTREAYHPANTHQNVNAKAAPKTRSAFDLRANYKNRHNGHTKSIPINRHKSDGRQTASSPVHILDDTTIQNISAGPYAQSSPLTQQNTNKDNQTPPPVQISEEQRKGLPAVSSSEWLAAGGMGKTRARKPSTTQPAGTMRSVSRYSPVRKVTGTVSPAGTSGGSPGQRLVTSWLDGKKGNENSPAFV